MFVFSTRQLRRSSVFRFSSPSSFTSFPHSRAVLPWQPSLISLVTISISPTKPIAFFGSLGFSGLRLLKPFPVGIPSSRFIAGAFFSPEDPQHLDSFIPLPRFEEVSSPYHLGLLWRKLRLCCVHLPAEVYQESNSVPDAKNTSNSKMKSEKNETNSIEHSSNSIESLSNSIEHSSNFINHSLESLDSLSNSIESSPVSPISPVSLSNSLSNSERFESQRIEAQRQKRELGEVSAACSAGLWVLLGFGFIFSEVFSREKAVEDVFRCLETLLFRSLPELKTAVLLEDAEETAVFDPAFDYLCFAYDLLAAVLGSRHIPAVFVENQLSNSFLRSCCRLFFSADPRERDCVRVQIHRIYAHFPAKRSTIRSILQNVLREFCADNCGLEGVQDLLRFYSAIIRGIALPIHPEHLAFLRFTLLPLLKKTRIECCFRGINDCITEFVKKDSSLAVLVDGNALVPCRSFKPCSNTGLEAT